MCAIEMRLLEGISHSGKENEDVPVPVKLLTAGLAVCIADFVTYPFETIKVRMQISGEGGAVFTQRLPRAGLLKTTRNIVKSGGIMGLYGGLFAGLQRQTCFAGVRFGLYETIRSIYSEVAEMEEGLSLPLRIRVIAGLTTGILAVLLAQPTDVVKIRFQAGNFGKSAIRYNSTLDAYKNIVTNEGVFGLYKGTYPNMMRNVIINVGEIICYEEAKKSIINSDLMKDGDACQLTAAIAASLCAAIVASPIDVVKTRFMNSHVGGYKSSIDTAGQMLRNEGPLSFYKGFIPSVARLVCWNIVLWVAYEQLKVLTNNISKNLKLFQPR